MEGDNEYETFAVESMVRGYHVYQEIWIAAVGEELPCVRETDNHRDQFAVAVARSGVINSRSHPKEIIFDFLHVFETGWYMMNCRITGERRYSEDHSQGGLEVPCILLLRGAASLEALKLEISVLKEALSETRSTVSRTNKVTPQPLKPQLRVLPDGDNSPTNNRPERNRETTAVWILKRTEKRLNHKPQVEKL